MTKTTKKTRKTPARRASPKRFNAAAAFARAVELLGQENRTHARRLVECERAWNVEHDRRLEEETELAELLCELGVPTLVVGKGGAPSPTPADRVRYVVTKLRGEIVRLELRGRP